MKKLPTSCSSDPADDFSAWQKATIDRYAVLEKPIVDDLSSVGISVEGVWKLASSKDRYERAIPFLLHHLSLGYPAGIRQGIANALAKKWARPLAWKQLVSAYLTEPNLPPVALKNEIGGQHEPKEAMANALAVMASVKDIDQIVALALDQNNGPSRMAFLSVIARSKKPEALNALEMLVGDPEIGREATVLTSRRKRGPRTKH